MSRFRGIIRTNVRIMVATSTLAPTARRRASKSDADHTRFERRLSEILGYATDVFCDKGYEGASMRDLSRATGMSLAGLYYYFESKEKLLYLIQKHTFETVLSDLRGKLEGLHDPEHKIRTFVQ